jgi:hypothetical protein
MSKTLPVQSQLIAAVLAAAGTFAVACGGGGGEPETPAAETPAATEEPAAEEAPAEPEAAPEPVEEEAPKPTAKDILLKEGTLFLVDFTKSDPGIKIEEKCAKKHAEDPAKKANCVSKDMEKLPREGITFDEDDEGKWWYIRFGIERNNVQVIYNKVEVQVGEPSGPKLTLTPTGKDQAKRRKGTVPKELVFEVPDEYTIVLLDPDRGRLEFEPKLGLLEDGKPQQ